jgi:hypothetical protein
MTTVAAVLGLTIGLGEAPLETVYHSWPGAAEGEPLGVGLMLVLADVSLIAGPLISVLSVFLAFQARPVPWFLLWFAVGAASTLPLLLMSIRAAPYSLPLMLSGSLASVIECVGRRLEKRCLLGSLLALTATLLYYFFLVGATYLTTTGEF